MPHRPRATSWLSLLGVCGLTLLSSACGTSPLIQTAREGKLPELRQALLAEQKTGELTRHRTERVAQALLEGEIERAQEPSALAWFPELSGCAPQLRSALQQRAKQEDLLGGESALLLAEQELWSGRAPRHFRESQVGGFRALAASAAQSSKDDELRHQFLLDGDPRVRSAAARVTLKRAQKGQLDPKQELPLLLEVSRLDPDASVRSPALLTLGALGGRSSVLRLRDRFPQASLEEKLIILEAWSQEASWEVGGREALEEQAARMQDGLPSVHAALLLSQPALDHPSLGVARLLLYLEQGTSEERVLAVQRLPSAHPQTEAALLQAAQSEDPRLALYANIRLRGRAAHQDQAEKKLLAIAREPGPYQLSAQAALAVFRSPQVLPLLKKRLRSSSPRERMLAGYHLLSFEAYPSLAPLLADETDVVRRSVACRLLSK